MGLCHLHQSIPADSELIRVSMDNPTNEDRWVLSFFGTHISQLKQNSKSRIGVQLISEYEKLYSQELKKIFKSDPTIANRNVEFEKWYYQVDYLLECAFPEKYIQDNSIIPKLVYGGTELPNCASSKYLSPHELDELINFLVRIDIDSLHEFWNWEDSPLSFEPADKVKYLLQLEKSVYELKDFFILAKSKNEGVLTTFH